MLLAGTRIRKRVGRHYSDENRAQTQHRGAFDITSDTRVCERKFVMPEVRTSVFSAIELFCSAARSSSFTAAAVSLGTTPSSISKAISKLEARLGVKLFERSTRAIRLTSEGQIYYVACEQAMKDMEEVEASLAGHVGEPRGVLRVSLPLSYGVCRVMPLIPAFVALHENRVKVIARFTNSISDFVKDGFDVAVRLGDIDEVSLVVRRLDDALYRVVASPSYLKLHGVPMHPRDLLDHQGIEMALPDTGRALRWEFVEGAALRELDVPSALSVDSPLACLAGAVHGAGLARLLDFTVDAAIESGALVEVLAEFRPPPVRISVVLPTRRHLSANVRAFIDFIVARQDPRP